MILRRKSGGFTLVEVIMIIVVAAIAVPVLLVVMGHGARLAVSPELSVSASNLAQGLMEREVFAKTYATLSSVSNSDTTGGISYTQSVSICNVPDSNLNDVSNCGQPATGYKRVTVNISFNLPENKQSSVELVTLITNHD